jgi:hydroxypyruvate isomerase
MLNRRDFAGLVTASLASPLLKLRARGQPSAATPQTPIIKTSAIKTSVMMWTLNKSGTFEQNLERIAQAGYTEIELVNEFKTWSEPDTRRVLARMHALGITVDAMAGMTLGFADPTGADAFLAELNALIPIARRLGCRQIILLSGKRIEVASGPSQDGSSQNPAQHTACIETLKRAAQVLAGAGLVGVIEPIDRLENPSIYLDGVTEAFAIVRIVDSPAIRVLYDLYHEQRTHGNLISKLEDNIELVGLIHVADVPGRHEPGTGEVNYGNIYRKLAQVKYKGTIAMEFYSTADLVETLRSAREQVERSFDASSPIQ